MNETKQIYNAIATLQDVENYMSSTDDGESTILEFKEITPSSSDDKKIKSLIAKEVCGFLNSNDGILCIGVKNDNGALTVSNAYVGSLEDLIDRNIANLFEPSPSGILTKTITAGSDTFIVMYVPYSNIAPHRIAANKNLESDVQKNYYTRMMSNSVPMPEHLVKAMYLSKGRLPSLGVYPMITKLSQSYIEIQHYLNPDKYKFIKKDEYYTEIQAVMFDGNFNMIHLEEGAILNIENSFASAIHPSDDIYTINTHTLHRILDQNLRDSDRAQNSFFPNVELPTYEFPEYDMENNQTKLHEAGFNAIYAIFIQTSIACEGMPLKTDRSLFYLTDAWHQKPMQLGGDVEFVEWSVEKGVKVLIPKSVDQKSMSLDGIGICVGKLSS